MLRVAVLRSPVQVSLADMTPDVPRIRETKLKELDLASYQIEICFDIRFLYIIERDKNRDKNGISVVEIDVW